MPVLRRPHDRHPDLRPCRPGARRHPRLPALGLLCRDPARQTSSRPPVRRASATGGACARGAHGLLDQANGRQIGPSSGITAARWHARRPFPPSGAAIPRHFAPVPPSPWGHRVLRIPITSPEPPRVRAWAVSVRRPHATPPLGWPASENLHQLRLIPSALTDGSDVTPFGRP